MQEMRFEAPETLDAAVALLTNAEGEARVLAGGTDLLVQLRAEMIEPALVVDIKRIPEMLAITQASDGGFRIGAAVPCQALGENMALKAARPGVVEGAELIGSTQIQGRASMGMLRFPARAHWYGNARNELLKFPQGNHDDFVDALAHIGLGLDVIIRAPAALAPKKEFAKVGTMGWVKEAANMERREERRQINLGGM